MAVELEDMLRSGERLVYRTPQGRLPEEWCIDIATALYFPLWIIGFGWAFFGWNAETIFVAAFILSALGTAAIFSANGENNAAVTDQRAFAIDTRNDKLVFASVELREVHGLEVWGRTLRITKADGTAAELKSPGRAAGIARALASEAGLPLPGLHRSRVGVASEATFFGALLGLAITMPAFSIVWRWALMATDWPLQLVYAGLASLAAVSAWFFGVGLASLPILRPFFTREELRQLVLRTRIFLSHPGVPEKNGRVPRLYLRFVDWLYGGPGNGAAAQGENHGA